MRLRNWLAFLLAAALAGPFARRARAGLPDDCAKLGSALVGHSCFHSTHGPFATRVATPGSASTPTTENLDPVHTEFRVGLAGSESSVSYQPKRSGAFGIFLGEDVKLRVYDPARSELGELLRVDGDTGCDGLPVAHVVQLSASVRYLLVFGPTQSRDVVLVIEYVDDFLIENGRDRDGDGFGAPSDTLRSVCVPTSGYVENSSDCDDQDPRIHPGAGERCGDEVDQNCNGLLDDDRLTCAGGEGACRVNGELACAGDGVVCDATALSGSSETCNGIDDDCDGQIDEGEKLCPEPDLPSCVRNGLGAFCGCLLDLDCGPSDSGRLCDTSSRRCVSGCESSPGRNGCPAGTHCNASTQQGICVPTSPDAGVGGQGSGGAMSASDGGSEAPTNAEAQTLSGPGDDGGCGCRAGRGAPGPTTRLAVVGALLVLLARRRQSALTRLAVFAGLGSSAACGGISARDEPDHRDRPHVHAHAPSDGLGGHGGRTGSMVGISGEACVPRLGDEPIVHACSHTTWGPFLPVAALPRPGSAASVSELQVAFQVDVVEAGARLAYQSTRDGDHVLFTDPFVDLDVRDARGRALPSLRLDPSGCETIATGILVALGRDETYTLELAPVVASHFTLFVEHLGAFGSEAWSHSCAD
jgi:hypothetical protein